MRNPMNPKTLYTLRTAARPVPRRELRRHYDAPGGLDADVAVLHRHALVTVDGDAVAWAGS